MKKIMMERIEFNMINFDDIDENEPIFVKEGKEFIGMIVNEKEGWIIRMGGPRGATGNHSTLRKCIESTYAENSKWDFYIN